METRGDTVNTKVRINQRVTKFYQKTSLFFFTVCFFYREEKDGVVRTKRRLGREKQLRRLCSLFMDGR